MTILIRKEDDESDDGDGTVPIASLEHCSSWSKSTTHAIKFGGSLAAHTSILSNEEAIDTIIAWLESAE